MDNTNHKPPAISAQDKNNLYLHVDLNSYFATMLQQENPKLRGKPIGVLKSEGRTCVIAASKEAKKFGVKTGMSKADALTVCPGMITVPASFTLYADATDRFISVLERLCPVVEVFSLDEAFLQYRAKDRLWKIPEELAQTIQAEIKQELGEWVSCNVGIARTRLLAKMAGETAAKGVVRRIQEQDELDLLASTSFEDTCGIGPRLARRLKHLGITRPLQILLQPEDQLRAVVGPFWVGQLRRMAIGEDPDFLQRLGTVQVSSETVRSVSRSITLFSLNNTDHEILCTLQNLTQEAVYKLRRLGLAGRQFSISLEGSARSANTMRLRTHQTLSQSVCHLGRIAEIIRELYYSLDRNEPVIRCRVRIGLLEPIAPRQTQLFDRWERFESINQAIEKIQERYGIYAISSARMVDSPVIHPEVTGYLGDKAFFLRKHEAGRAMVAERFQAYAGESS